LSCSSRLVGDHCTSLSTQAADAKPAVHAGDRIGSGLPCHNWTSSTQGAAMVGKLSPMQLLALALIGGFIAGAKLGK
jgi:hypothetical protein